MAGGILMFSGMGVFVPMQLLTHLTKIPAFIYLGFSFQDHWQYILLFSIVGIAGTRFGVHLLHKIGSQLFFRLMRVALFWPVFVSCTN